MPADAPVHDPEELLGIMAADLRQPVEVREVIARVVDGSRFEEFKPRYGPTLVCGWASIHGFPVGVLGNNGAAVQRLLAEGGAVHPALQPDRRAAAVPAAHHRLHGRPRLRAGRHRQARQPDDQRAVELDRAAHDGHPRRELRRRELRHGRAGVRHPQADANHFHHRFARIGFSQRRTVTYLYAWTATMAGLAIALRFVPYSDDHGAFRTGWTILIAGLMVIALAASVYVVYTLEILKFKRFRMREARGAGTRSRSTRSTGAWKRSSRPASSPASAQRAPPSSHRTVAAIQGPGTH